MSIDLAVLGLALVLGLLGWFSGGWRQGLGVLGLCGSVLPAKLFADRFELQLAQLLERRAYVGGVVGMLGAFLFLYVLWKLLVLLLSMYLRRGQQLPPPGRPSRAAGVGLGALQGALLGLVALSIVARAEHELVVVARRHNLPLSESRVLKVAAQHSVAEWAAPVVKEGLTLWNNTSSEPTANVATAGPPRQGASNAALVPFIGQAMEAKRKADEANEARIRAVSSALRE